ncbi:hypothetical protein AB205_0010990 [Aquarana catesbeiana]|uniref:Uncharacterized protein n=1 Tax=Aquarana catesbeiana TaxID=8400 RepID=A0A2G9SAG6_AQUCT|nr:hypothetical protein AB205_0010990 [Aquarana catesbeiana]
MSKIWSVPALASLLFLHSCVKPSEGCIGEGTLPFLPEHLLIAPLPLLCVFPMHCLLPTKIVYLATVERDRNNMSYFFIFFMLLFLPDSWCYARIHHGILDFISRISRSSSLDRHWILLTFCSPSVYWLCCVFVFIFLLLFTFYTVKIFHSERLK